MFIATKLRPSSLQPLARASSPLTRTTTTISSPTHTRACHTNHALKLKDNTLNTKLESRVTVACVNRNEFLGCSREVMHEDTTTTIIKKISDNHSDVALVLKRLKIDCKKIDKLLPFRHYLYILDKLGIYGENINTLFKKCCHTNSIFFFTLLRSIDLKLINELFVHRAISFQIPINETYLKDKLSEIQKTLGTNFNSKRDIEIK